MPQTKMSLTKYLTLELSAVPLGSKVMLASFCSFPLAGAVTQGGGTSSTRLPPTPPPPGYLPPPVSHRVPGAGRVGLLGRITRRTLGLPSSSLRIYWLPACLSRTHIPRRSLWLASGEGQTKTHTKKRKREKGVMEGGGGGVVVVVVVV